jgi:hypothetical protein
MTWTPATAACRRSTWPTTPPPRRHRHRALGAGLRLDDFNSCVAHGLSYDDILNPVQGNGCYAADFPLFGGLHIWKAIPVILEALKNAGRLMATSPSPTATRTAGATRRR